MAYVAYNPIDLNMDHTVNTHGRLQRAISRFSSFLRNENQTIFGWDIAKEVKKTRYGVLVYGGGHLLEGAFIRCFTVYKKKEKEEEKEEKTRI